MREARRLPGERWAIAEGREIAAKALPKVGRDVRARAVVGVTAGIERCQCDVVTRRQRDGQRAVLPA
jgi:hypothetical protein